MIKVYVKYMKILISSVYFSKYYNVGVVLFLQYKICKHYILKMLVL